MEHAQVSCVTKRKDILSYPSRDFHLNSSLFHMNTVTPRYLPEKTPSSSSLGSQYNGFINKSHFINQWYFVTRGRKVRSHLSSLTTGYNYISVIFYKRTFCKFVLLLLHSYPTRNQLSLSLRIRWFIASYSCTMRCKHKNDEGDNLLSHHHGARVRNRETIV